MVLSTQTHSYTSACRQTHTHTPLGLRKGVDLLSRLNALRAKVWVSSQRAGGWLSLSLICRETKAIRLKPGTLGMAEETEA